MSSPRRASARSLASMAVCTASLVVLLGAKQQEQGCGAGLDNRAGEPGIDVGGPDGADWDVTYDDAIEVVVKNAGAAVLTQTVSLAAGGPVDIGGTEVDLHALCARPDIACPSEVLPHQVRMTQPFPELHLLTVTFNAEGPLAELKQTTLLGNVDSDFDFSVALGVGAAALGPCGLLSVSYATGSINVDSSTPPTGTYLSGDVVTAYSGGCLLYNGQTTAAAGLTVELRTSFTAKRR